MAMLIRRTITGGAGADLLSGGIGNNTFRQANGDSVNAAATAFSATIANNDSIIFGGGVDIITDFYSLTDDLVADTAGASNLVSKVANNTAVGNYFAIGDYVGQSFIISAAGDDILFVATTAVDLNVAANLGDTSVVLNGAAANWNATNNIII